MAFHYSYEEYFETLIKKCQTWIMFLNLWK